MSTRPSTPSWLFASSRPLLARALNERSLRPPMSVTRPTLIFLPAGLAAVEDDDELLLDVSLELPQAATPNAVTDMVRAMAIALRERRCTDPPSGGPRAWASQGPSQGGQSTCAGGCRQLGRREVPRAVRARRSWRVRHRPSSPAGRR